MKVLVFVALLALSLRAESMKVNGYEVAINGKNTCSIQIDDSVIKINSDTTSLTIDLEYTEDKFTVVIDNVEWNFKKEAL